MMDLADDVRRELEQLRKQLLAQELTLPASLSAQALFARMDAMEDAEISTEAAAAAAEFLAGAGGSETAVQTGAEAAADDGPAGVLPFPGTGDGGAAPADSPARMRPLRRRWIGAAAVLALVTAVCYSRLFPGLNFASGAGAPNNKAEDTAQAASSSAAVQSCEEAESVEMDSAVFPYAGEGGGDKSPTGEPGSQTDGAAPEEQNQLLMSGSTEPGSSAYSYAVSNTVAVRDVAAESFSLPQDARGVYDAADLVVTAVVFPQLGDAAQTPPVSGCAARVTAVIRGDAADFDGFTFFGGCYALSDYLDAAPGSQKEAAASFQAENALSDAQMETGYIRVRVQNQPILEDGGEYLLMLRRTGTGWELLESPYAVMPLRDSEIFDYLGNAYGTAESFTLSR